MYSCDHFVTRDNFLGNIDNTPMIEMVASPRQQKFGRDKLDLSAPLLPGVPGSLCLPRRLPKDRFIKTPTGEVGLNYLCKGYKAFFKHIDRPMHVMTALLRENRAPSEIMQIVQDL